MLQTVVNERSLISFNYTFTDLSVRPLWRCTDYSQKYGTVAGSSIGG